VWKLILAEVEGGKSVKPVAEFVRACTLGRCFALAVRASPGVRCSNPSKQTSVTD
jgi:hypothetical protein